MLSPQTGQPPVGAHPQVVMAVQDQRGYGIGGQPLTGGHVAHLLRTQVVVVNAAAVGGYPQARGSVEAHGIDKVVVVDIAELFGIEEAVDASRGEVDAVGTMGRSHSRRRMVGRLNDALHLLDGIFLAA